jgi:nitrogenase-associated protein
MAIVLFWEKPGCIHNTRQKKLLREAGHEVIEHNLLTEPWEAAGLRRFFGGLPVTAWFNSSAPAIKQGQVLPETLGEEQALRLMLADPLLIHRPLMQVGERCASGFDLVRVDEWIGLPPEDAAPVDLETCPKSANAGAGCESRP